ncbi:hypothetical protein [Hydrogenimonas sp.]
MRVFKITGKVIGSESKEGIKGLRVEVWDKDLLVNDMVGSTITGENGVFRVQFDESYFKELFFDRRPDLFFKIFKGTKLIKSTEDSVLWNVDREDIEQTIEVEEVNDMITPKNIGVFVRQRGSEVFKFVTIRPFQRQDEAAIEKKKVLCFHPDRRSDFHQELWDIKENPPEGSGPREAMIAKAHEYIETEGSTFVRNIHDLWNPLSPRSSQPTGEKSSLGILEEWIFRQKQPISYDELLSEVKAAYNSDNIGDIVDLDSQEDPFKFNQDKYRLQDSIMALSIVPSFPHKHRDRLVNALRICRIIERMAQIEKNPDTDDALKQSYGIEKAMKAPVALPTDIFPLPPAKKNEVKTPSDQNKEREEKLQRLREKHTVLRAAIEELDHLKPDDYVQPSSSSIEIYSALTKEDINHLSASTRAFCRELDLDLTKKTILELVDKLEAERLQAKEAKTVEIKSAIEELLKLAVSRSSKHAEVPAITEDWKPWTLSQERVGRLDETTRQVIQELGYDLTQDPVPQVMNALEEELAYIGAQLFVPPQRKRVIRYGKSNFEFLPGIEVSPWPPGELELNQVPELHCHVEPVGFGEYNSVRQTLLRYEDGEIAHIENVLRGEYKERVHRRLRRLEEALTYEEERKAVTEKDLQSTDRFELKREASETIKEEHKADAGVTVKYDTPTVKVEAKAGYTYDHAKEQAKKTSVSYARDVTQKSLSRLEEKVREVRTQKTLEEFEETNTHGIDNKDKPDHAIGIYRWVDKIYEAQVISYGERLFFDFIIPEPAAFYLYALTHRETGDIEEPMPPTACANNGFPCFDPDMDIHPLQPSDITPENYMAWVSMYEVSGVETPPEQFISKGYAFSKEAERTGAGAPNIYESYTIPIPEGYQAIALIARGSSINCGELAYYIDIGGYVHPLCKIGQTVWLLGSGIYIGQKGERTGDFQPGIPISIEVIGTGGYVLNVSLFCQRTKEFLEQWQLKIYESIMQAYYKQKADYEEKLAAAAIQEGISISGRNPGQNQEIIETELKKWALSMLTGQDFTLFNAMETDSLGQYPGINFSEAKAEDRLIRFFEQAFEWPLMTYLFYPYFWGKRQAGWKEGPTWTDKIINIKDIDPLFEKFLKAGAARITVPVREGPEWANTIINYISTGEVWNGGEAPTIDDPLYVSIVEEIQQQQGAYVEKSEGTISVEHGSNQVVGTNTKFEESDAEHEIYIERKRYIIAEVQDAEHLTLTEPYGGETNGYIRYYIGAKLVGGPWEVKVPTSLVHLQKDNELPDFEE